MMAAAEEAKPLLSALEEEAPSIAAYLSDFAHHCLTHWISAAAQATANGFAATPVGAWRSPDVIPYLQMLHRHSGPPDSVMRVANLAYVSCNGNPAVVSALTVPMLLSVNRAVDSVIAATVRHMIAGGTAESITDALSNEIGEAAAITILEIQNILLNFHRATA